MTLAACNQAEPAPEAAAPDPAAAMVGTYEETTEDGKTQTSLLNADGTYAEMIDGAVTENGTWSVQLDQACFDPEGDDPEAPTRCFNTTEPAEDGTFTATPVGSEEGFTVKKVSDTTPAADATPTAE